MLDIQRRNSTSPRSGLRSMPDHIEPDVARGVAAASALTGISIAAVSGTYNMIHPEQAGAPRWHGAARGAMPKPARRWELD